MDEPLAVAKVKDVRIELQNSHKPANASSEQRATMANDTASRGASYASDVFAELCRKNNVQLSLFRPPTAESTPANDTGGVGDTEGNRLSSQEDERRRRKVVKIANLPADCEEADIVRTLQHKEYFGNISYVELLRDSRSAFVEFENGVAAAKCLRFAQNKSNCIKVLNVQVQVFATNKTSLCRRSELESADPTKVLFLQIHGEAEHRKLNVRDLHGICAEAEVSSALLRIAIDHFPGNAVESFLEFSSIEETIRAKFALNAQDIFPNASAVHRCTIAAEFANMDEVDVPQNDDDHFDFTTVSPLNTTHDDASTETVLKLVEPKPEPDDDDDIKTILVLKPGMLASVSAFESDRHTPQAPSIPEDVSREISTSTNNELDSAMPDMTSSSLSGTAISTSTSVSSPITDLALQNVMKILKSNFGSKILTTSKEPAGAVATAAVQPSSAPKKIDEFDKSLDIDDVPMTTPAKPQLKITLAAKRKISGGAVAKQSESKRHKDDASSEASASTLPTEPVEQYDPFAYLHASPVVYSSDMSQSNVQGFNYHGQDILPIGGFGFNEASSVLEVAGIDSRETNCDHLFNLFSLYGNVCKIIFHRKQNPFSDYVNAKVQMGDQVAAQRAARHLDRTILFESVIRVSYSRVDYIRLPNHAYDLSDPARSPSFKDYSNSRLNRFRGVSALKNRISVPKSSLYFTAPKDATEEEIRKVLKWHDTSSPLTFQFLPQLPSASEISDTVTGKISFKSVERAVDALALAHGAALPDSGGILKLWFFGGNAFNEVGELAKCSESTTSDRAGGRVLNQVDLPKL